MSELISQEAFKVIEGRPVTSSRIVAEYFEKRHDAVIRDIRTLISKKPELNHLHNFVEMVETVDIGSGATREAKVFMMDRKGFSILAMGFTGAKALDFKCAFYDEFERMEQALHPTCPVAAAQTIDAAQQLAVRNAVARRAKNVAVHYQTIYHALYERFQIPRYTDLRRVDFNDALNFIETCDLNVPEKVTNQARDEAGVFFSRNECIAMMNFIYVMRYLFQPVFAAFYEFLCKTSSPLAPRFHEAFTAISLGTIENRLAEKGFNVQDMPCYQHLMSKRA